MTEDHVKRPSSSWIELKLELKKRTLEPLVHASFVMYFVVAIIVIGGVGFWIELYTYLLLTTPPPGQIASLSALRAALITFFPALAGSACLHLVWAENSHKSLRAFGIFFLCLMTVIALVISPNAAVGNLAALVFGVLSSIAALWVWWIANARQKDLLDDIDPDAPLGGNKNANLAGDLDGFKF